MHRLERPLAYLGIILASLVLFYWVYGFEVLHPSAMGWLIAGDPAQTFFGLNFFLQEPWQWPLGVIRSYNAPIGTSLVYTDSVPIWSISLKYLKTLGWIHTPAQFTGIWMLLCLTLQGWVSTRLFLKENFRAHEAFLGALLLTAWPAWFFRTIESTQHYSLLAHFLILSGISLLLDWMVRKEFKLWKWWCLLLLALGIHFYLFAMVAFLYLIPCLERPMRTPHFWKTTVRDQAALAVLLLSTGAILGYFEIPAGEAKGGGFSLFAMDFISFLSSDGRSASQPLEILNYRGPREGFQYLGLGIILACAWIWSQNRDRLTLQVLKTTLTQYPVRSLVFLFILLLAVSRRFWIFGYRVPMIPTQIAILGLFYWLVQMLLKHWKRHHLILLSILALAFYNAVGTILRASGRMGWVIGYGIAVWILIQLKKQLHKRFTLALLAITLTQLWDLRPLLQYVSEKHPSPRANSTGLHIHPDLDSFLSQDIDKITLMGTEYFSPADLLSAALIKKISIGPNYLARHDHKQREKLIQQKITELKSGVTPLNESVAIADIPEQQSLIQHVLSESSLTVSKVSGYWLVKKKLPCGQNRMPHWECRKGFLSE